MDILSNLLAFLVAPYCAIPRDYLSDTPLLRAMGFLVSQHGQLGAIPLPPFLSVSPVESIQSGGAIPPQDSKSCSENDLLTPRILKNHLYKPRGEPSPCLLLLLNVLIARTHKLGVPRALDMCKERASAIGLATTSGFTPDQHWLRPTSHYQLTMSLPHVLFKVLL